MPRRPLFVLTSLLWLVLNREIPQGSWESHLEKPRKSTLTFCHQELNGSNILQSFPSSFSGSPLYRIFRRNYIWATLSSATTLNQSNISHRVASGKCDWGLWGPSTGLMNFPFNLVLMLKVFHLTSPCPVERMHHQSYRLQRYVRYTINIEAIESIDFCSVDLRRYWYQVPSRT